MRALVTGAGGFLGMALVRALVARGDAVRALVRSAPPDGLAQAGVEVIRADATDADALRGAVGGCDAVFHLAGVRRARDAAEFMRVNAGSTGAVLDACVAGAPGLRRFVLAGSRAASPPSPEPVREDAPLAPAEPYGASKAEAERIAFAFADRLPVAVARPPRIMGAGDRENLLFFRIARAGLVLRFGGPRRPLSWIDVDDCAAGLLALADRPEAAGEAFFLAAPEPTTAEELQDAAARALGVAPRTVTVPPWALRAAGAAADAVGRFTGRRLPVSGKLVAQLLAPGWACDPSKARERLGFTASTPLTVSIERAARWYRARGLVR